MLIINNNLIFAETNDKVICEYLGLTLEEYQSILYKFNGILDKSTLCVNFYNLLDAEKAQNFLNERLDIFLVQKQLTGE